MPIRPGTRNGSNYLNNKKYLKDLDEADPDNAPEEDEDTDEEDSSEEQASRKKKRKKKKSLAKLRKRVGKLAARNKKAARKLKTIA